MRGPDNSYAGALLGRGAVPPHLCAALGPCLVELGAALATRGYRGSLGLDAATDRRGRPVPLELNVRRGASSFVRAIGARLFGDGWAQTYQALNRPPRPLARATGIDLLLNICDGVDRQLRAIGGRLLPICAAGVPPAAPLLGYVAFGHDNRAVAHAERLLLARLGRGGITFLE